MADTSPSTTDSPFTPLTAEEELRLWPLAVHAAHLLSRLRYVDYRQAEEDAALLARKIQDHYTQAEVRQMAFVGMPRGGLIVLGMLAYQLDLLPQQFQPAAPQNAGAVCLVDDCALSGLRLQQALTVLPGRRVIVAHLYSAPSLRANVLQQFPFVENCLAARDLAEDQPAENALSSDNRLETLLDGRLFSGSAETVAFAWNEPDLLLHMPFDDQPAHQWRFLPPHKCLKNRQALGLPPAAPVGEEWTVPLGIVYGWFDGVLYLLDTRRHDVVRLDGFAADCWRAAAGYGALNTALAFLEKRNPQTRREDLKSHLEENLVLFEARGLLQSRSQHSR